MSAIRLPDYSQYLTPENLEVEKQAWARVRYEVDYAEGLMEAVRLAPARSIVELGCGVGLVPTQLPDWLDYTGVDANPGCLEAARAANPTRAFVLSDIRNLEPKELRRDVSCSFAVLKHFGLHEWDGIASKLLSLGAVSVFTIPVAETDKDTSWAECHDRYHHVWISMDRLERVLRGAGHAIVSTRVLRTEETLVITRATAAVKR